MRSLVIAAVLWAGTARADSVHEPRNEVGVGGGINLATRGPGAAAFFRAFGGRLWEHVGFRFEYSIGGIGFDDIRRYAYMHRGVASVRLRSAFYKEETGRIDGFLDFGAGRQAIHWYDGPTDWRNEVSIATGVRFDGIRDDGGYIAWGVSILTIIAPAVEKTAPAERATTPSEHGGRDVIVYLAFESAI